MFDLQVNGLTTDKFSCDFWQAPSNESIQDLCEYEFQNGINNFLATVITDSFEKIKSNIQRIQDYRDKYDLDAHSSHQSKRAHILGVHVEGGLISRLGIHPEKYAQELNLENAKELVNKFPDLIKLWTLCPKLDSNGDLTKFLQDHGIKVAYGHSNANYDEALKAFEKYDVNLVTHWGNAMKIIDKLDNRNIKQEELNSLDTIDTNNIQERNSIGLALAAYHNPKVYTPAICGSKANGDLHLDPLLIKKLAEKKQDKFILVSDSVASNPNSSNGLRGGLTTLAEHSKNALQIGLSKIEIERATKINPYLALGISTN